MRRPEKKGRTLVIGLGNPLSGDDGFGAEVIERLRHTRELRGAVDLLDAHTDLLGHMDRFAGYDQVILVDTVLDAGRSGEVVTCEEKGFIGWPDFAATCHQISPLTAVKLFRRLQPGAQTRIRLVALCVEEITMTPGLTEGAGVDAAVERIRRLADRRSQGPLADLGDGTSRGR